MDLSLPTVSVGCVFVTENQVQPVRAVVSVRICLMTSMHQAVGEADACCLGMLLSQLNCSKYGSTLLVHGIKWAPLCVVCSRADVSWNWVR